MDRLFHWFWGDGIFYILYGVIVIAGLIASKSIMETPLKEKVNQWQYRNRLRKVRADRTPSTTFQYRQPLVKHIYLLIKTTSKEKSEQEVLSFLVITSLLFLFMTTLVFIQFKDIFFAAILGALVGMIPYMVLQLRLRKLRFLMGTEFLSIVQSLTQNYNANSYDMYHALIETQKKIESKQLRTVFLKLISDLQVSKNEDELRLSVTVFVYTAGSSWAKRLGNIIVKSYLYHENVLNTLLVLTRQIEETEEMLEQEKSHTLDSVFNGYLTVPVFILSVILGYFIAGPQDWFKLQFQNPWALSVITMASIGVVFSVFISMMLKRPKNDI
ncbi:hypothetical protein ACFFIX_20555 [Metabacillus herbersteinensis]|uniref:Type II secretion system protein GspF domain-containing protein n=1 Tax=Metabacillus herbersteinensis TaxID=283816 RepID=A0ABV6GJB3_9BACI